MPSRRWPGRHVQRAIRQLPGREVFRAAHDVTVDKILVAAVLHTPRLFKPRSILDVLGTPAEPVFDTNNPDFVNGNREGLYRIPLSTRDGRRNGVTEFIYATKDQARKRLRLRWEQRGILADPVSGTAVLEYGPTEILPPVASVSKHPARLC